MADVLRFTSHASRIRPSSSLTTTFPPSLNTLQLDFSIQNSYQRFRPLSYFAYRPRKQLLSFKTQAAVTAMEQPKWWEKSVPNMIDINSMQEFLGALSQAGDRLVIVEFFGTWCASCRALFPKLCKTAEEHPEIVFLKINFDENKSMCRSMNVKYLPYFHFYRGADGQLESFSCSLIKFQKIKDAIERHNTAHHSIGLPNGVSTVKPEEAYLALMEKQAE